MKEHQTLAPETRKFRLGIFGGDLTQPISMMRILGPFSAMMKEDERLEIVLPSAVNGHYELGWSWLCRCDAIFYSHPTTDVDLGVIALAHHMGVKVWIEYVDDIFSVLPTNPAYQNVKNRRAIREAVTQAIALADFTSSVSQLCAAAYPFSDRIGVIPEACLWPAKQLPRRKAISWRGLDSHDGDTDGIIDAVCRVAKEFPDWEWVLMGKPSEDLVERLTFAAGKDADGESMVKVAPFFATPWHAIHAWSYRAPYLHIAPLADNEFNRAKSHLAWLEASAVGAAVIAPDYLPEWQQPGVIPYSGGVVSFNGKQDFEATLRREMKTYDIAPGTLHLNVLEARQAIYPQRTEPYINQLRWQVLRKLAASAAPETKSTAVEPAAV